MTYPDGGPIDVGKSLTDEEVDGLLLCKKLASGPDLTGAPVLLCKVDHPSRPCTGDDCQNSLV